MRMPTSSPDLVMQATESSERNSLLSPAFIRQGESFNRNGWPAPEGQASRFCREFLLIAVVVIRFLRRDFRHIVQKVLVRPVFIHELEHEVHRLGRIHVGKELAQYPDSLALRSEEHTSELQSPD